MEAKWLDDFSSVARTGSFSRSAVERNVTQSAFSRRIKALEQWVGVALIDRSTYPTRLTRAGERFRDAAQEATASLNHTRLELRQAARADRQLLRIAIQLVAVPGLSIRNAVFAIALVSRPPMARRMRDESMATRNTRPGNLFGHCGVSLPIHHLGAPLPVGLQLCAGGGSDVRLLALACSVEQVLGRPAPAPAEPLLA